MASDRTLGVVIPVYDPDIPTLESFISDINKLVNPEVIRIEIDAPNQAHIDCLDEIAEVNASDDRRGKGCAIMEGFDALTTDILAFADADGSVPASSIVNIVDQIDEGTADVSIGSRRHPSSHIVTEQTVVRQLLGDVFAFTARGMLPVHCRDYQCGAKAVRSDVWDTLGNHCYESGFAWDLEFISVAGSLGYDIAEVPVEWEDHPNSTVSPVGTTLELIVGLVGVRGRTNAIATSPRFRDVTRTKSSTLIEESAGNQT